MLHLPHKDSGYPGTLTSRFLDIDFIMTAYVLSIGRFVTHHLAQFFRAPYFPINPLISSYGTAPSVSALYVPEVLASSAMRRRRPMAARCGPEP